MTEFPVQDEKPCCSEITTLFDTSLFKALGDPNRVAILASLAISAEERTVSQIAELFDLNFSVVSRHLKILKESQILAARKDGKEVRYQVNGSTLASALRKMATALENCCEKSECGTREE